MAASIVLTGLASNDPVPGTYLQISFAQGGLTGYQGTRPILLVGNGTTSGIATRDTVVYGPDTPIPCQTEADVINLFGNGSELHRMWRKATKFNNTTPIYFICVTSSAGAAATVVFTFATVPNASGTATIWGGDIMSQFSYAASAALATITAGLVTAINSNYGAPYSASQTTVTSSNDSVTLTAKEPGPRGDWLRGQAAINNATGGTPNMTVTNTTDTFFTGGTTADSNATALGTILPKRYYYLVSAAEDSTQVGAFATQVTSQALPVNGLRQRLFVGSTDTSGNITTIATTVNNARGEFIWEQDCPWTPAELAAFHAGLYALYENSGSKPKINWSGYGNGPGDTYGVPQSRLTSVAPTRATIFSLLMNGVTPIGYNGSTSTYLVKRITSYCLNGANPDFRIRDAGKVTICDFFGDDLVAITNANWLGKTFGNEPAAGAPNQPDSSVITPNLYRLDIFGLLDRYVQLNLLLNIAATKASAIVQQDPSNTNRMDVGLQLYTVSPCDQFALLILEVA